MNHPMANKTNWYNIRYKGYLYHFEVNAPVNIDFHDSKQNRPYPGPRLGNKVSKKAKIRN